MNTMSKTPIYNHNSLETAYMIDDYPYGSMRCRMRVWLEHKASKGWRLMQQTENPKNLVWNKPKASTYVMLAACMYIDTENNHVEWDGITEYSDHAKVLEFVKTFPGADIKLLTVWSLKKVAMYKALVNKTAHFTMNGEKQEATPTEIEDYKNSLEGWSAVVAAIKGLNENADKKIESL